MVCESAPVGGAMSLQPRYQIETLRTMPGQMPEQFNPNEWTFMAREFHPNRMTIVAVESKGFCLRSLPAWIDAQKFYSRVPH